MPALMESAIMHPLADRVLVELEDTEKVSPGGIALPDVAQEAPRKGWVLAVGPGRRENGVIYPVPVSVGDQVLFGRYAGQDVEEGGRKLKILSECDLLAITITGNGEVPDWVGG